MALHKHHSPLIRQGWKRAILLFAVYLLISLAIISLTDLLELPSVSNTDATASPAYHLDNPSLVATIVALFIFSAALVYVFRKYIDRKSIRRLSVGFTRFSPHGLIGLMLGITLSGASAMLLFFSGSLQWSLGSVNVADMLVYLALLFMAAAGEEIVFRGYILKNLAKSFKPVIALAISAVLFMVVHAGNPSMNLIAAVNIFLAAILTGMYYLSVPNLWFPVAFHFTWNFIQGPVLGFPVSGILSRSTLSPDINGSIIFTGGAFGLEGSVICSILFCSSIALLYYFRFKRRRKTDATSSF